MRDIMFENVAMAFFSYKLYCELCYKLKANYLK